MQGLENIYRLGLKELISLRHDIVLIVLMIYAFTIGIYVPATGSGLDLRNASVAMVDEDRSQLSARIADGFLPPYFQAIQKLQLDEIDKAMDAGRYTFVIDIPPNYQADVLAGRRPDIQVNVDATAMSQAGIGAGYVKRILTDELEHFLRGRTTKISPAPVASDVRIVFNPNLESGWFMGVMQMINWITMLAVVLTGAALIREREHGTIDHLLVMPVTPVQIILAKTWASGLVIVIAAGLSLWLIIIGALHVPVAGSIPLFLFGIVVYLFSLSAIGVYLGTVARSMPQLGLLFIPVVIPMLLLSGGFTPLDSMPEAIQTAMKFSPSTHFVEFATAVLFRGASLAEVWQAGLSMAALGAVFFTGALLRFRKSIAARHA